MASHTMEREIFSLSENVNEVINSTRPFSLASDGRLLLCCRETIFIFTISCDLDDRSHSFIKNLPCKLNVQKSVNLSRLPSFSIAKGILDMKNTLGKVLNDGDGQELLIDSSLHGIDFFPKAELGGFRSAVFSSPDSSMQRFFIAATTHDHRVLVFEEHSEDWRLCCEFTAKLKSHVTASIDMPMTLGTPGMSFTQYKDFIHSMSCVEIAWSSLFVHQTGLKIENGAFLLFCGMRNGDVHIWNMQALPGTAETDENSFTFIAVDKYSSEVASLFWQHTGSNQGHLAVGYMDGNVRILNIQLTANDTFNVNVVFAQKSGDHLAVSDLASTKINHDTCILLACKQFSISIFTIKDVRVEHFKTIYIDCSLPLESLSVRGNLASVSSQDGAIHHFHFKNDGDDISFQHVKSKVMCLPNVTETTWSCKGVALSHHGALCYSIHRPFSDFTYKSQFHGRFLDRQRLILSLTPNFQNEDFLLSSQDMYTSMWSGVDVTLRLLILLQNSFKESLALEMIQKILNRFVSSERIECLQIARAVYLFEFLKILKGSSGEPLLTLSKGDKLRELAFAILIKHVSHCFQSAQECQVEWQAQLPFMCLWVNESQERLEALAKCMNVDKNSISIQGESASYLCCLCDSKVKILDDLLEAKCINGHCVQLCCVTFHPVEGSKLRRCLSCNAVALDYGSVERIMSIPYIRRVHSCTLCGGRLR